MQELKIKKTNKILIIFKYLIYVILLFIFLLSLFINNKFGNISFEQLLYSIINTKGASYEVVAEGFEFIFVRMLIIILIIIIIRIVFKFLKIRVFFNFGFKNKIKKIDIFKKTKIKSTLFFFSFMFFCIFSSIKMLSIHEYILNQIYSSKIFEEFYINPKTVNIKFPKNKKNLIYIYVESMETTNVTNENGGLQESSYIPNLEKLALDNINFSNTNKLGGAFQMYNTSWTIAGLIAHTAGVPLKLSVNSNSYQSDSKFLPGIYNLGDILYDNGYNNFFMIGSDADFGRRRNYFESHGNYRIYDYEYAVEKEYIDSDYFVWWGYEDKKLFKYAKEKILKASKYDKPFNFTLLTADTHFTDGYMDDTCEEIFESKYANSIYCSDSKINEFVNWLKKQDFYKDTVIIITGDHLTMQSNFYNNANNYDRTIYNTIINSKTKPIQEKNRAFSSFDMFPTTLAALGVEIEGNKLGLGVNLFSKEKTLIEELGYKYFNDELSKKSFYYDNVLLGDTYYEMEEYNKNKETK